MSQKNTSHQVNALRHHAVIGPSANALMHFYEYFGFTQLVVEEYPEVDYIGALTGGAWTAARILKLRNSDGDVLEIIEPNFRLGAESSGDIANWSHIAFTVSSCDDAVSDVLEMGGHLVGGPVTNPEAPFRVAYVRDPALNLIELVQRL